MSQPTCLPRPVPLVRPLPQRAWSAGVDGLRRVRDVLVRWLKAPVVTRCCQVSARVFASLDERTLRDIGVPDSLRAEAEVHRRADHLTLAALQVDVLQQHLRRGW
jgi:hypothetical protein